MVCLEYTLNHNQKGTNYTCIPQIYVHIELAPTMYM